MLTEKARRHLMVTLRKQGFDLDHVRIGTELASRKIAPVPIDPLERLLERARCERGSRCIERRDFPAQRRSKADASWTRRGGLGAAGS
jgi:hypothetical protein